MTYPAYTENLVTKTFTKFRIKELAVTPEVPSWWQTAVVYQVYIRSFADGNGDGIGDIQGLRARRFRPIDTAHGSATPRPLQTQASPRLSSAQKGGRENGPQRAVKKA